MAIKLCSSYDYTFEQGMNGTNETLDIDSSTDYLRVFDEWRQTCWEKYHGKAADKNNAENKLGANFLSFVAHSLLANILEAVETFLLTLALSRSRSALSATRL